MNFKPCPENHSQNNHWQYKKQLSFFQDLKIHLQILQAYGILAIFFCQKTFCNRISILCRKFFIYLLINPNPIDYYTVRKFTLIVLPCPRTKLCRQDNISRLFTNQILICHSYGLLTVNVKYIGIFCPL